MDSRRKQNAKKVTGILALMFGVVPLCFFYYSIERNVRTRRTLDRSCEVLREARSRALPKSELVRLYGEAEGAHLDAALERSLLAHCEDLRGELSWWTWNVRRDVEMSVPEAARERLGELPEQIGDRCARAGASLCAQKEALLRGFLPVPSASEPPWFWASRVSAIARKIVEADGGNVGRLSPY